MNLQYSVGNDIFGEFVKTKCTCVCLCAYEHASVCNAEMGKLQSLISLYLNINHNDFFYNILEHRTGIVRKRAGIKRFPAISKEALNVLSKTKVFVKFICHLHLIAIIVFC